MNKKVFTLKFCGFRFRGSKIFQMRGRTMKNVPLGRASRKNEKGSLSFGADDIYFGGTFGYFIDYRIIVNKSRGCFSTGSLRGPT